LSAQQVREIFAEVLGLPVQEVTDALAYESVMEWDSLAHMALIAVLNETFAITIALDDVTEMRSVGKAMEILARYGVPVDYGERVSGSQEPP
jgi:acyl carrier protein